MNGTGVNGSVTMADVARRAQVSVKTVSNVVNDYPHIRPATRARVEDAIAALGYRMNASARSLRQGRTGHIGLAVPDLTLPYFAELAETVIEVAAQHRMSVLVEQTGGEREAELAVLENERHSLTDGTIYSPLALGPEDAELLAVDFPLVVLGERIFSPLHDHVTMNNVDAARAATQHLIDLGRRRIAVIGAHPDETVGSSPLRVLGYRAALASSGIEYDPALVVPTGPWDRRAGLEAVNALVRAGTEFDAVFGLNDTLALGALSGLHAHGCHIPDDVAVIGFDDVEAAEFAAPPLSSVSPGREQIAAEAVRLLRERIAGSREPGRRIVADYTVRERASTHTVSGTDAR